MTTDDDRIAYLAGEATADVDDATRADLDELRGFLADPAVWAEPRPGLEDDIVAAIAGEAAERTAIAPPTPDRATATADPPPAQRARGRRRRRRARPRRVRAAHSVGDDGATEFSLQPTDVVPGASGSGSARRTDSGWRIELDASGLPRLDDGRFYQAWLRNDDDVLVPIGTFNEGRDVVLWSGVTPVGSRRSRSPWRRRTATRRRPGAACSSARSTSSPDSDNPWPLRPRTAGKLRRMQV